MNQPLVTMLIPTFGRAARQSPVLNECLYWCCQQTYHNLEILVLNDAPKQKLHCPNPRVRVVNADRRFKNLGDKMNWGLEEALGEICLIAEDDDISLPHRVEQAVKMLDGYEYWGPGLWLYAPEGHISQIDGNGVGHNCSAYRREPMRGKYNSIILGHDRDAAIFATTYLKCNPNRVTPQEVSYVYRWGVSHLHLSGASDPQRAWDQFYPGKPGPYVIEPKRGRVDWVVEVQNAAARYPIKPSS